MSLVTKKQTVMQVGLKEKHKIIMKTIREFFYRLRLRNQKRRALFEIEQDLRYLETFKSDMFKYDEGKARKRMAELKQKEKRTEIEDAEFDKILEVISQSKAVKNEFNQSKKVAEDVRNYISLL